MKSPPVPEQSSPENTIGPHLGSWKEIAAYVKRDVSTVQRWEKREGMPVHRHLHDKRGSVYALPSELDAWLKTRSQNLEVERTTSELRSQAGQRLAVWLLAGGVVVLAVAAVFSLVTRNNSKNTARIGSEFRSVAVLPFENLSGKDSEEYLADGLTEEVIGRLAGIQGLRVISRTSVMRFKTARPSVPEIAKMLGVDTIVEGSVIRDGNRIRVHAQMIRAASDEHFWAESYDREFKDVLALESELAQAIAAKVEVSLTGRERSRLSTVRFVTPEVYENYLKGVVTLNGSNSKEGLAQSIRYFEEAIRKDPTFAPAYVALGNANQELSTVFMGAPPQTVRPKVLDAARKALELDPELAEAHQLLGMLEQTEWHWNDAEAEYRRALELKPSDAAAHFGMARWLVSQGRTDEAVAMAKRGRELDPLAVSGADIGWILFQSRRYEEAEREFRSVVAVRPDDATALWFLGFVLIQKHEPDKAIAPLERSLSLSDRSAGTIGILVRAYAHAGREADALRLMQELQQRGQAGYVPAAAFVNAYLGLGDTEQAFVWLERAYAEHSMILQYLKVHPYFDPLREDPRFKNLVRRVGLE